MNWFIAATSFLMLLSLKEIKQQPQRWIVYYNDKATVEEFDPYNPIILDSDHHPYLEGFIQNGKTILGYISLGEVEKERAYFKDVKEEGILLEENKNWPGSYFVDLRDPRWTKRVIEELIPDILMKRFQGLFFDTLDNAAHLEQSDPERYKGMTAAAINLVKTIRMHYPQIKIMMNRGYGLLPELVNFIDMELGESVYADYDFDKKNYQLVSESTYKQQVAILKEAQKLNPELQVYTLDYWNPDDPEGIKKIYQEERKNGFIPYVATIDLHKFVREPR